MLSAATPPATRDNTFSLVALCRASGRLAVAVSTARPAVGNRVPFVMPRVAAVATQAETNPALGYAALRLIHSGASAENALETVLASDPGREQRQLSLIDATGNKAVFTGKTVLAENTWAGSLTGHSCIAAGNLLLDSAVLQAMVAAFETSGGFIGTRMLRALEAGQAAGGDRRGKVSAALLVTGEGEHPLIDLRIDLAEKPVEDLVRLYAAYTAIDPQAAG